MSTITTFFISNLKETFSRFYFSDFNYGILHVVGSYIFRSFCSQACQNSILNQLPDSEIQLQTPITIQIRVNGVAYTYTFWAINFNALTTGTTEEIELTYYMTPNTATRRRRLRRQIVNSANNQPIISLVSEIISLIHIKILILIINQTITNKIIRKV